MKNSNKTSATLKKTLRNQGVLGGKSQKMEITLQKTFKQFQKSQKKSHKKIINLSILNLTSLFRIIGLKNKHKKKKSKKKIPAFLSHYKFRTDKALKTLLLNTTALRTHAHSFEERLSKEILQTSFYESGNKSISSINELNSVVLKEKKYFRFYRW